MGRRQRGAVDGRTGAVAFEAHYHALFGPRWPALRAAMAAPERKAWRPHPFHPEAPRPTADADAVIGVAGAWHGAHAGGDEALVFYQDPASMRVAALADAAPGMAVLDMCAAPGGKTLWLAEALTRDDGLVGTLQANELSAARRLRLRRLLQGWLRPNVAAAVVVTGHDASRFGLHRPQAYDRVLLDAPCSSERHVLADAAALAAWTPARPRQLAQRQFALLCAAIDACRPGGRVIYATCALDEQENDGVVGRALARRGGDVAAVTLDATDARLTGAEATTWGRRWLPDRCGEGPMFVAVLRR